MTAPSARSDLVVREVTVRFGGLVAVRDVSLTGRAGHITGLIGPNGAGKTTILNACAGVVSTARGEIALGPRKLSGLSSSRRAACGLGRTFQRMELFVSLTVRENVEMGAEGRLASRRIGGSLVGTRRERSAVRDMAARAIELCGIAPLSDRNAGDLSTGQRRMVEFARAIASDFEFLMLDEPSSGLDSDESDHFADILVKVTEATGIGVLLVEHDMSLVAKVCDYIHVLDFGQLIAAGPAKETLGSDIVKSAYLGSEAVEPISPNTRRGATRVGTGA